jgi:hypothetical protein
MISTQWITTNKKGEVRKEKHLSPKIRHRNAMTEDSFYNMVDELSI